MFVTIWGRQKMETTGRARLGVFPAKAQTQEPRSRAGRAYSGRVTNATDILVTEPAGVKCRAPRAAITVGGLPSSFKGEDETTIRGPARRPSAGRTCHIWGHLSRPAVSTSPLPREFMLIDGQA